MIRTTRWQATHQAAILERLAYPLTYLFNRPMFHGIAQLLYDFALRCNGIGVAFSDKDGLTKSEKNFLRRIAPTLRGATILDVGANEGAYAGTIKALVPECSIYAFEPHPRTFANLQNRAKKDGFVALQLAVSDTAGPVRLFDFADQDGSTQASLDPETIRFQHAGAQTTYDVQSTTLDDFADASALETIDLLKIDTEGFDLAVLKGAARLISQRRIKLIQFEIIPVNVVRHITVKDFFELLVDYNLYRMCMNGQLLPIGPYSVKSCEIYVTQNLVAVLKA